MRTLAAILLAFLLPLAGCDQQAVAPSERSGPMRIVATTGMVTDAVRAIAGEHAEVEGLMGPGVDPHLYQPSRDDVATLLGADAIFYNGLLLEGKMADALVRTATSGKPVFAVTELVDEASLLEPEEFEGLFDPHLWMDPAAWIGCVEVVGQKLAELDPDHADSYAANTEAYVAEIRALDAYAEGVLASVPENQRVLVTAHDAFNYFGRRFGYEVVGIQGISTESEAGIADIESLVSLLVERDVPAVFVESTVSQRSIEALIAGARARGHEVVIGGELFSDAMGARGTYEGTYLGMIDHNVTTIARALGGDAPEKGVAGKLAE
ncbi:MAG: zinc ABC transporter substrate-binding protein [Planctomycetota bacterium]